MRPVAEQPLLDEHTTATPWEEARQHLERADCYWLATVLPDGRPHVMPLLAVWVDDALHFVANRDTRKARNLALDARCVVTTATQQLHLVIEGDASKVRAEADLRRVAGVYVSKYGWEVEVRDGAFHAEGAPTAGPPPYEVYRVSPTTIFAFGTDETTSPTRWRF